MKDKLMKISILVYCFVCCMIFGASAKAATPDNCEPNNSMEEAVPYTQASAFDTQITANSDVYTLGMRHAGLHDENDEDWYTISLSKGTEYIMDIRNTGARNWYIEVLHYDNGKVNEKYSTNPDDQTEFEKADEKYKTFTPNYSGTYYIHVVNGGDWAEGMHYFFYVGLKQRSFSFVDILTHGYTTVYGTNYRTYTADMTDIAPRGAVITSLSVTDTFPDGNACSELDKRITINGRNFTNTSGTGNSTINLGSNQPLFGSTWTLGAKCARRSHVTTWSAEVSGRVSCQMQIPYE